MTTRLVIAGTHSGVGKTTITVGLIDALRRRGLTVQPFKVGPDYIDPTYHSLAAGRPCRNLDTWMLPPDRVRDLFARAAAPAAFALIEGVMGLYDGSDYDGETGSTAEVASFYAPVVLVLDASKMARSAGAIALGYQRFDDALPLAGFIVNRVASESHGKGVASAVERATGLPVLGWLPRDAQLQVPERHLGLIPTAEPGSWEAFTQSAGRMVDRHIDVARLLALSITIVHDVPRVQKPKTGHGLLCRKAVRSDRIHAVRTRPDRMNAVTTNAARRLFDRAGHGPVIAVARDEAFHFTYEDNLDLLRAAGAHIVFFSPLHDAALPERTSGIILSGGFPEVDADRLSANRAMHAALRHAHERDMPIYGECGGLMYLTQAIADSTGASRPMVGLIPGHCAMAERLTLGYRLARSAGDSWFMAEDETIRGHEFHYSVWQDRPADLPPAYYLLPRSGEGEPRPDGARFGNLWASYVHVHFGAKPELAERFVKVCRQPLEGVR